MEVKKSDKANLENKVVLFREIGFVVVLLLILGAFELGISESNSGNTMAIVTDDDETEMVEVTREEQQPEPEQPKPEEPKKEEKGKKEIEIVVDVETTGLDYTKERIIEFGDYCLKYMNLFINDGRLKILKSAKKNSKKFNGHRGILPKSTVMFVNKEKKVVY